MKPDAALGILSMLCSKSCLFTTSLFNVTTRRAGAKTAAFNDLDKLVWAAHWWVALDVCFLRSRINIDPRDTGYLGQGVLDVQCATSATRQGPYKLVNAKDPGFFAL